MLDARLSNPRPAECHRALTLLPPSPLAERLASDQEVCQRGGSASAVATTAFAGSRSLDRVEISRRAWRLGAA